MSPTRQSRVVSFLALSGLLIVPDAALAQAWVPDKGDGSVSVAAQELNVKKHLATRRSPTRGTSTRS